MSDASPPPDDPRDAQRVDPLDDRPPLLGSWRALYLLVIGTLVILVGVFWWLTKAYA